MRVRTVTEIQKFDRYKGGTVNGAPKVRPVIRYIVWRLFGFPVHVGAEMVKPIKAPYTFVR